MQNAEKIEIYKTLFTVWSAQVDSYWQRSNYFAAFETAAIAGAWYLNENRNFKAEMGLGLLGIALTIIWLLSNSATHNYVSYWWDALQNTEKHLGLQQDGLGFVTNHPGSGGAIPYSTLVQLVPAIFGVAWICLLVRDAARLCGCGG
jgi:hypothetical protein